jgi:hypothetical protein
MRTSEENAKSLLALIRNLSNPTDQALPNDVLEREFVSTEGSGADFAAGRAFAIERGWVTVGVEGIRLTVTGKPEI